MRAPPLWFCSFVPPPPPHPPPPHCIPFHSIMGYFEMDNVMFSVRALGLVIFTYLYVYDMCGLVLLLLAASTVGLSLFLSLSLSLSLSISLCFSHVLNFLLSGFIHIHVLTFPFATQSWLV